MLFCQLTLSYKGSWFAQHDKTWGFIHILLQIFSCNCSNVRGRFLWVHTIWNLGFCNFLGFDVWVSDDKYYYKPFNSHSILEQIMNQAKRSSATKHPAFFWWIHWGFENSKNSKKSPYNHWISWIWEHVQYLATNCTNDSICYFVRPTVHHIVFNITLKVNLHLWNQLWLLPKMADLLKFQNYWDLFRNIITKFWCNFGWSQGSVMPIEVTKLGLQVQECQILSFCFR